MSNQSIPAGELILLVSPRGKRYLHAIPPEGTTGPSSEVHTHDGKMLFADLASAGFGGWVRTHLGKPYRVLKPSLHDLIKGVKRQTQIMYPKEIGYLLLRLGVRPGGFIIESGTGSGGLTLALAWFVGPDGKVASYERREEFSNLAAKNLRRVGLEDRVELVCKDIEEGFDHTGAEGLFLDVRTPWDYLRHIPAAVIPGAVCGFLLPTVNQVSELLAGLAQGPFGDPEVIEILLRRWKPVPDRLRPDDRMVAHTGFLVFARCMDQAPPPPAPEPEAGSELENGLDMDSEFDSELDREFGPDAVD